MARAGVSSVSASLAWVQSLEWFTCVLTNTIEELAYPVVHASVWIASSPTSVQRQLKSSAWSGRPQKAAWMNGSCQGATKRSPIREQHHSFQKFTMSSPKNSAHVHSSASTALTAVDGAKQKGCEKLSPLEEVPLPSYSSGMESQGCPSIQALQNHLSPSG